MICWVGCNHPDGEICAARALHDPNSVIGRDPTVGGRLPSGRVVNVPTLRYRAGVLLRARQDTKHEPKWHEKVPIHGDLTNVKR